MRFALVISVLLSYSTTATVTTTHGLLPDGLLRYSKVTATCPGLLKSMAHCARHHGTWLSKHSNGTQTSVDVCWWMYDHTVSVVVAVQDHNPTQSDSRPPVFQLRMIGPQMVLMPVHNCGSGQQFGVLRHLRPGVYNLEAVRLFVAFSYEDKEPWPIPTAVASFMLKAFQYEELPSTTSKICTTDSVIGSWYSKQPHHPWLQSLRLTEVQPEHPLTKGYNTTLLAWTPHGCRFRTYKELAEQGCLRDRHPCFIGDSHMRYLYNAYVQYLPYVLQGQESPVINGCLKHCYTALESPLASSFWDTYGEINDTKRFQNCTHVVSNAGSWHLAFGRESGPDTIDFVEKLTLRARMLSALAKGGKRVLWSTIPAMLTADRRKDSRGVEHRSDPWIARYNGIAVGVMSVHGVDVFDMHAITAPLVHLSSDMSHFPGDGAIGHAMNIYISNTFCNS